MLPEKSFAQVLRAVSALQPEPDDVAEFIAERAAIMHYDGGLTRSEAEQAAVQRARTVFHSGRPTWSRSVP